MSDVEEYEVGTSFKLFYSMEYVFTNAFGRSEKIVQARVARKGGKKAWVCSYEGSPCAPILTVTV